MSDQPTTHPFSYRAFVLRVWHEGDNGAWRASLQSVGTGKRLIFNTLERLCVHLLTLDDPIITSEPQTVNEPTPSSG